MAEVFVYNWGMSVKDHVAKFGDITDPKYKDFTNFKLWKEPEILEAEIVNGDEDEERNQIERLNELYPEMTEQEQISIERQVISENPNASEAELLDLLVGAIRRFNVDRRVARYYDDLEEEEP